MGEMESYKSNKQPGCLRGNKEASLAGGRGETRVGRALP